MKIDLRKSPRVGLGGLMTALILSMAACSSDDGTTTPGSGSGSGSGAPPVAVNDGPFVVAPGATRTVSVASGVLANDTVPAGLASLTIVTPATHTSSPVVLNSDGSFTYRHANSSAANSRTDSFVYEVQDNLGQTAQATVQIVANTAPVAFNDLYQIPLEPRCLAVLSNDSDAESDPLTVVEVFKVVGIRQPTINSSGRVCIDPSSANSAQFDYTVADNFGGEDTATAFINFEGATNPDVFAKNDTFTVARGGTLTVSAPGVILNDDIDGAAATQNTSARVELASGREPNQHDSRTVAAGGAGPFVLSAIGAFQYVHDGSDQTVDTFDYVLVEGTGAAARRSSAATVSIQILEADQNEAPKARDEVVRVNLGAAVDVPVLYNDTDREDGVPRYVTITQAPACGTVDDQFMHVKGSPAPSNNLGVVRYQHNSSLAGCRVQGDTEQTDSFAYRVADSNGATDQATVTVRVSTAANRAPTPANDEVGTPADQILKIVVLQNDIDPDGDPVILELADGLDADDINGCDNAPGQTDEDDECNTQRATGKVTFFPDTGVITYEPVSTDIVAPPYSDVFEYKVNDGRGKIGRASVTINVRGNAVNQGPVACDDPRDTIAEDNPPSGCVDLSRTGAVDSRGAPIRLFTVPACSSHELALNILVNDTDSDPEDRPPYRFRMPSDQDPNPPRLVVHAPADSQFGVGALRIAEAPTVTGTGSSSSPNNGRRSVLRVSDDRRYLYYQHVGAENTHCDLSTFVDTFTYVVTDDKGRSDEGIVQVTVDAARLPADADSDGVPDSEDQCRNSNPPTPGVQTATPSTTVFTNGCNLLQVGTPLRNSFGYMTSVDQDPNPDAASNRQPDGFRGTDDICPLVYNPAQNPTDANTNGIPDECEVGGPIVVGPDADNDGITDADDNCPNGRGNPSQQADEDGDLADTDQTDTDNDGAGNICDNDNDGDGVADSADQCPNNAGTGLGLVNPGCPGL